jgi:DNA-binding transcriptional MerR regulator
MDKNASGAWTVGEMAARCGLSVDTLPHYEREGLLSQAHRTGGQRRHQIDDEGADVADAGAAKVVDVPLAGNNELINHAANLPALQLSRPPSGFRIQAPRRKKRR